LILINHEINKAPKSPLTPHLSRPVRIPAPTVSGALNVSLSAVLIHTILFPTVTHNASRAVSFRIFFISSVKPSIFIRDIYFRWPNSSPWIIFWGSWKCHIRFCGTKTPLPTFLTLAIDVTQIIGGGTAGLTVAARLAENPAWSVAVIEAGGFYEIDNGNISQIPAFAGTFTGADPSSTQPLIDWNIETAPQQQLNGRSLHYPSGKTLGGGSARNILAYQRGTSGSYQAWADNVGDQSYSFANLLPFFQRSVRFTSPNYSKRGRNSTTLFNASAFSPHGGPLHVSYSNYWLPISPYAKDAFVKSGFTQIAGFNSGKLLGFSEFSTTINPEAAIRSSSETSFLQEAILSSSLQVYQQTTARKILFNAKNMATGVNVVTSGKSYTLSARQEVIVAAGTFRSPQMLMVSGIGPGATLKSLGIPVISNLSGVGQNMWDQPFFGLTYRVNIATHSELMSNRSFLSIATSEFLRNQTGPLTSTGTAFVGWEKIPCSLRNDLSNSTLAALDKFPADWPELEILPHATVAIPIADIANTFGFDGPKNYASINIAILTPTSRGNVTINSTDTDKNPIISPNWLSTTEDQEMAIAGFKRARQIASATPLLDNEVFPGPVVQSDAEILAFLKNTTVTIYHASATCAMGRRGDPAAVVDTHGKVFGVSRLRVVDASAFNLLPPGHCQSTVYALAEKLADDIRNKR